MKALVIAFAAIIAILLGVLLLVPSPKGQPSSAVAPTLSPDGHLEIDVPRADDLALSPVAVEGKVTGGGWFFEASFPIKVLDGDGRILGSGTAQALSDWMSTGTVPFAASIHFTAPHFATGTILFQNDNPSGLPANQKSLSVPVRFR